MASSLLSSAANSIILAWGWRRAAIAVLAGAVSALALPPFSLFPLLWLTFPVLVLLIDGADPRSAAAVGWLFGFGYFLAGLWWIGSAFLVEAEVFAWMLPFAVAALPAGLALFWAAAAALARLAWSDGPGRLFALAGAFGAAEWLRGVVLTGFPWNAPGTALAAHDITMQAGSIIGIDGLTVLAMFVFAAPVLILPQRGGGGSGRLGVGIAAIAVVAGLVGFGVIRLADAGNATVPGVAIRVVQPNVAQEEKWTPANRARIFNTLLELSDRSPAPGMGGIAAVTHLIWPETALPFLLPRAQQEMGAIAALLPEGTHLVTGALRIEPVPDHPLGGKVYNSIYVIDGTGTITDAYDKIHLVPFGEYLPFQSLFDWLGLEPLTRQIGGFSPGLGRDNLMIGSAPPALPLICYEAIFPGLDGSRPARPGWLLNLTNDAWFGVTPGPYQHLHQARMRAVEQGLPLVRAANTGISAIIDSYGRVRGRLGLEQTGVVDGPLPAGLEPTLFSRFGSSGTALLVALCFALALLLPRLRF